MSSSEFGSAMLVINYLSSYNFITQESFAFGTWSVVTNCEHNLVIGDSQTESQCKAKGCFKKNNPLYSGIGPKRV